MNIPPPSEQEARRLSMVPGQHDFEVESCARGPGRLSQMPLGRIVLGVVVVALLAHWFWPQFAIRHAEGVVVNGDPWQGPPPATGDVWSRDGYTITSLATIELEARVLHTRRYYIGRESDISKYDLALGWGIMSDQWLVDQLDFSQSRRWYFYKFQQPPPVATRIMREHSGNFHTIAATDEVYDTIKHLRPGHFIFLKGQLVRVTSPDGWHWQSSLSRTDRGDGACELVWVEQIEILDDGQ